MFVVLTGEREIEQERKACEQVGLVQAFDQIADETERAQSLHIVNPVHHEDLRPIQWFVRLLDQIIDTECLDLVRDDLEALQGWRESLSLLVCEEVLQNVKVQVFDGHVARLGWIQDARSLVGAEADESIEGAVSDVYVLVVKDAQNVFRAEYYALNPAGVACNGE